MRARRLSGVLSSSSDAWEEWELRGVVFLSLALQIALICLGDCRKYLPHAWIGVVTWLAYLSADSVAIYALGLITSMIREINVGKSLSKMDPHTELGTFWAPFLLLHLGGPDTISAYAIEDNELWLRHLLTLVNQTGLTVYVLVMAWTHPTLSFLAILILLSGFYKYGERVWVLRAASSECFKDSLAKSQPRQMDLNKIVEECELKQAEGYNVVLHQVINVDNVDAIMIDVAIAKFLYKKPSSGKDLEDQEYKCVVGTLLSASCLVNTSQRLFADHVFSMEECDRCLSILSSKHRPWDMKVIEIELGLICDMFYSKASAVYTKLGFICRLAILSSIWVALVVFYFTDKRPYSKPDLFLTFLLLGAATFVELYALVHMLFSDQVTCWLIKNKRSAIFNFINRIKSLPKRHRWSYSMGQYNLMSFRGDDSCWWTFLKLLHVDEVVVKFLYQGHKDVTDEIKNVILLKIKEMKARATQKVPFQMMDWGSHALSKHKLLVNFKWSIELDFDMSILVWHIVTHLCYYLDYEWWSNNDKTRLMSVHLSRYMLYLQFMCPSMLPARIGSISFRDVYEVPSRKFDLPEFYQDRPACGHNRRERKPDDWETRSARKSLLREVESLASESVSKEEDQVRYVFSKGCKMALELKDVKDEEKWPAIREVWVEMLVYAAHKCKARDHARHMRGGSELITHVWLLMGHYGLTDHFQKLHGPPATAEMIVNP